MTNLVGILCGDKIWKQLFSAGLLVVILSTMFLSSFVSVFAQAGGIPGVDRPFRPGENPNGMDYGTPLSPNDPNLLPPRPGTGPDAGADGGEYSGRGESPGGPMTEAERAQAVENAMVAENVGSTPDGVLGLFHTYVLTGVGWVVGQAGSAFDYAIDRFVVGFGDLYINGNVGAVIDDLWQTVRDIFNLTFIFGLVYIGFKMILDSSDSSARKMLVSLIGAALLVNFSLFITKFVIDFSNIAAAQIFGAFTSSGAFSITNGFMTLLGVQSLIGVQYTTGGSFAYIIGMLIIFAVLAYVFLAGAIMIIIRFVVLNIYMVFSPFMFLGWVFPAMAGYSRDYWSGFLRQAFFAPAFLFMLYLSYRVAASFNFSRQSLGHVFNSNGQSAAEAIDSMGVIPYFAMVIVFLCASMIVAKKMGAHGASSVVSTGKFMASKTGGALTFGLAARAGRTVVGGSASALTQNQTFRRFAGRTGFVGKGMMLGAAKVADSSFDARNVGGLGKNLGVGSGKKGGFTTRLKESKEQDEKYDKLMGKIDPEDNARVKEHRATIAKLTKELNGTTDDAVREQIEARIQIANKQLGEALTEAKKPENVYANQLNYIKGKENWLKKQKALLNGVTAVGVGIGAGLLTGGIVTGVAAAAAAYGATKGVNGHTKADIKALKKEFGEKGENKKKNDDDKAAAKAIAQALKDAGEAPKPKEDDH